MSWIRAFKDSVGWGDSINSTTIGGIDCCWTTVPFGNGFHYWVAGQLVHAQQAYSDARKVKELTGAGVGVLFIDKQATELQVEEAMHETAHGDIGFNFLETQPRVHRDSLLWKYQEGMTFELFSQETGGEP